MVEGQRVRKTSSISLLWLVARDAAEDGARAPIVRVRYLWTDVHFDPDAPPTGHWRKPPRAEIQGGVFRRLGEDVIVGAEGD